MRLPSTARDIAAAYPNSAPIAHKIVEVAKRQGIADPGWLANLINFESAGRWSSSVQNPNSGATGLIQFMPSTARGMGTTTEYLASLSELEQMDWVEEYIAGRIKSHGPLNSHIDLYMAIFYPVSIGNPDYQFPSNVVAANNGIQTPRQYAAKADERSKLPYDDNVIGSGGFNWWWLAAGAALLIGVASMDWE